MAIYAISDLHLSFGVKKPMNVFGKVWDNYEEKIKKDWEEKVKEDDVVILPGDISWGINFKEATKDFEYINNLPGKKIYLRGNHDYYFNTKTKFENFLKEEEFNTIHVLHNNAMDLGSYILCGARGWGRTDGNTKEEDDKIIKREAGRLKISLDEGVKIKEKYEKDGISKDIIVAIHYPPFLKDFKELLEKYNVKKCMYGHLHGYGHMQVKEGLIDGVEYIMVGCDYTGFKLKNIDK